MEIGPVTENRAPYYKRVKNDPNGYPFASGGPQVSDDMVNSPPHYNKAGIEVIDVIETYWPTNYHMGNVIKYALRAPYKQDELTDLRKAQWYLDRYIKRLEEDANTVRGMAEIKGNQEGDR